MGSQVVPPSVPPVNLARFDLVSIQLVVLCADRGSLAKAARMANMTKSTASHRLSTLERSFGRALFLREPSGLRLTEFGAVFVARGRLILQEVRGLGHQLAALAE